MTQKKLWVCLSFSVVHHFICFLMGPITSQQNTQLRVCLSPLISWRWQQESKNLAKHLAVTMILLTNHEKKNRGMTCTFDSPYHKSQPWSRASATGSKQGLISLCEREKFLSYAFLCLFGSASTLDSL